MTNKETLIQACKNQAEVLEVKSPYTIRGYEGQEVKGDVVCLLGSYDLDESYDLGFCWNGESFNMVADFSLGSCGGGSKDLVTLANRIVKEYAKLEAYKLGNSNKSLASANISVKVH
jgi:hypothetical protein